MQKTVRRLWGNKFLKGSAVFTISSFMTNVMNYLFNIFTARALGPAGFGEITALFSYTIIFSVPTLVMSLVVIQKIGSKGDIAQRYALAMYDWFYAKMTKWWFFLVPAMLISPFIPQVTNLSPASGYILVPFIVLSFVGAFYGALMQGLQLLLWVSFIGIISVVLKLAGAVLVLFGVDGVNTVLTFLMVSTVATLYISHVVIKKSIAPAEHLKVSKIEKRIVHAVFNKQVVITTLSILALTVFNNIDIIFVKKFFTANEAGIYSSWSLFAKIILYVTGPATIVSYIFFSDKKSQKDHEKVLVLSLAALLIIAISSYVVYKYFSLLVIGIFFGSKFGGVAPYLAGASLFGSFYTTIAFINNYFLAKKSKYSLLLIAFIPVYFILFFFIPKSLANIIALNIYFSAGVMLVYLVAYARTFFYNRVGWKKESTTTS